MNDDSKKPLPQDDAVYDAETHRLKSRYDNSLNNAGSTIDDLDQDDLLPDDADLAAGLDDDAFAGFDNDERTLPSDNPNNVLETGMQEADQDNLVGSNNLGDVILRIEDSIEDSIEDDFSLDENLKSRKPDLEEKDLQEFEDGHIAE